MSVLLNIIIDDRIIMFNLLSNIIKDIFIIFDRGLNNNIFSGKFIVLIKLNIENIFLIYLGFIFFCISVVIIGLFIDIKNFIKDYIDI